jgi:hypothetical protein
MKNLIKTSVLLFIAISFMTFTSCKKEPSILKVYVKSAANQLVPGARVTIAGDIYSNPATREYQDTAITNSTGYATFDMDKYFGSKPEKGEVGYFDVYIKSDNKNGKIDGARVRVHITNVETVKLEN